MGAVRVNPRASAQVRQASFTANTGGAATVTPPGVNLALVLDMWCTSDFDVLLVRFGSQGFRAYKGTWVSGSYVPRGLFNTSITCAYTYLDA